MNCKRTAGSLGRGEREEERLKIAEVTNGATELRPLALTYVCLEGGVRGPGHGSEAARNLLMNCYRFLRFDASI